MKKLSGLTLLLVLFTTPIFAQNKESDLWNGYERVYPLYNYTIYGGVGKIPFGNMVMPKYSEDLIISDFSLFCGVSYNLTNVPIGFYAETSLFHFYGSYSWTPDNLYLNPAYSFFLLYNVAHSANVGVLIGKEVHKKLGIYGKAGLGLTQNNYTIHYIASNSPNTITEHQSNIAYNYQVGVNLRYFPMPFIGVTSGLNISHNMPAFNFSLAFKFGYKKKPD